MGIKVSADFVGPAAGLLKGGANLKRAIESKMDRAIQVEARKILRKAKDATPVVSGVAKGGWKLVRESSGEIVVFEILNNVKYITVLEYGSYPVRAVSRARDAKGAIRRGRAYVGGKFKPGKKTKKAPGGEPKMLKPGNVSRQAPRGMIRKALKSSQKRTEKKVESAISSAINKAFGNR